MRRLEKQAWNQGEQGSRQQRGAAPLRSGLDHPSSAAGTTTPPWLYHIAATVLRSLLPSVNFPAAPEGVWQLKTQNTRGVYVCNLLMRSYAHNIKARMGNLAPSASVVGAPNPDAHSEDFFKSRKERFLKNRKWGYKALHRSLLLLWLPNTPIYSIYLHFNNFFFFFT